MASGICALVLEHRSLNYSWGVSICRRHSTCISASFLGTCLGPQNGTIPELLQQTPCFRRWILWVCFACTSTIFAPCASCALCHLRKRGAREYRAVPDTTILPRHFVSPAIRHRRESRRVVRKRLGRLWATQESKERLSRPHRKLPDGRMSPDSVSGSGFPVMYCALYFGCGMPGGRDFQ